LLATSGRTATQSHGGAGSHQLTHDPTACAAAVRLGARKLVQRIKLSGNFVRRLSIWTTLLTGWTTLLTVQPTAQRERW